MPQVIFFTPTSRRLLSSCARHLNKEPYHHYHRASSLLTCACAACMTMKVGFIRSFSSSVSSAQKRPTSKPDVKQVLLKSLDSEIAVQKRITDGPESSMPPLPQLIEEYHQFLSNAKWEIRDSPGLATVELVCPMDNGNQLTVRFDVRNVVEGSQEAMEEEDEEDFEGDPEASKVQPEAIDDEEATDFMEEEHIYPLEVELKTVQGKKLVFDVEYNVDLAEKPLVVTNATFLNPEIKADLAQNEYSYTGPQYDQLDHTLREAMDNYVNRLVHGELLQFINDYAFSKEATQYGRWLQDIKTVVTSSSSTSISST